MNKKVLLFTHESDIDGIGNVVLAKLAFNNVDYILALNINDLELKFRNAIEDKSIYNYDYIFVTDLALYNPALDLVANDETLNKKVRIFDHHQSSIDDGVDKYDFINIIEVDNHNKKRSATDLFYSYLSDNNFINKNNTLDEFVELTRLEDTWEWKTNESIGNKAHDLAILFNAIGIDAYIKSMIAKINANKGISFNNDELETINKKKQEYIDMINSIWDTKVILTDEFNNRLAALYCSYEYRNEISEHARTFNEDDVDYIVMVAFDKGENGQKSYRAVKDTCDVAKITSAHNGGGHPAAASVLITKEQKEKCLRLKEGNLKDSLEYIVNCSYEK